MTVGVVAKKFMKSILVLTIFVFGTGALIELIVTTIDRNRYTAPGEMVEVNGEEMHVFITGSGDQTIVLVPGLGTASPYVDFQPLWSRLRQEQRVVVVERFGYGFSQLSNTERSIEMIAQEMKQALQNVGEQPPYTFVGHSLGGAISMAYAQMYPDEVGNIIMLDAALPQVFSEMEAPPAIVFLAFQFLRQSGLVRGFTRSREIMAAFRRDQNEYRLVPQQFWPLDRALFIRNSMNANHQSEFRLVATGMQSMLEQPYSYGIPTLFISTPSLYDYSPLVYQAQKEFLDNAARATLVELAGGHYIHHYHPKTIAREILDFL